MHAGGFLDRLPLGAFFLLTVALTFASVEGGYRWGRLRRRGAETERESPVGAMVGATLGLLGFMLAFTFGLAASRFEARRVTILDEANAIGTTYLRSSFLPEPERSESQRLLRRYVDVRLSITQNDNLERAVAESTALHAKLWTQAVAAAGRDSRSVPTGLFIQSLNEVIDLHSKRVMVGVRNRIPGAIWMALYFLAVLGMGEIGYHEGLTSPRRSPAALAVVLTFSVVMSLIADLDRPVEGVFRVSQQSMIDLRNSFREPSQ